MKVCLVTVYSPREITGVGEVVVNLGKGLQERGHDFVTLTKSSEEDLPSISRLVEIKYKRTRLIGGLLLILGAMYWLMKERKNIDLLHLHSISWLTTACALLGTFLGIPRVLTLHGKFPALPHRIPNAFFRLNQGLIVRFSNSITCVSEDTRRHHGLDAASIIYNGVDSSRFRKDPDGRNGKRMELGLGDRFVLLYVGRLDINKGIRELIEVIGGLIHKNADLRLLIVGSGDDEMVSRCIRENHLEKHATMVGRVENTVPYYQSSDLFVLFSAFEGIPLTLLEAMACGLPCLATSVGGIPEVITDGVDGYLVQPGDKKLLNAAILRVLENEGAVRAVSSEARMTIENRFSSSRMIDEYMGVYESLIKS